MILVAMVNQVMVVMVKVLSHGKQSCFDGDKYHSDNGCCNGDSKLS